MFTKKKLLIVLTLSLLAFVFTAPAATKPNEYDAIVRHLQTKYQAKKVRVPFIWLARFAVKGVRPAGFKSFNVTFFEDLKFSRDKLALKMREAMKNCLARIGARSSMSAHAMASKSICTCETPGRM